MKNSNRNSSGETTTKAWTGYWCAVVGSFFIEYINSGMPVSDVVQKIPAPINVNSQVA